MINKKLFITFFFFFLCAGLFAQEQMRIPPEILNAFKTGNASELSKYLNPTVQIMLLGKEDFYKKNVAETILKDFFTGYRPKEFIVKHQGGTGDARYAIGNLRTDKNNFRVYFLLKKVGSDLLIHQIRIDPDESK
ncbi:MAG: DUF4783 domain-containing protein [Bacteroidales bacterium]